MKLLIGLSIILSSILMTQNSYGASNTIQGSDNIRVSGSAPSVTAGSASNYTEQGAADCPLKAALDASHGATIFSKIKKPGNNTDGVIKNTVDRGS